MSLLQILGLGTLAVALAVWQAVRSGQRFVQAFVFLEGLDRGLAVEQANAEARAQMARQADQMEKARAAMRARNFAKANTKGRQDLVIKMAREKGFHA